MLSREKVREIVKKKGRKRIGEYRERGLISYSFLSIFYLLSTTCRFRVLVLEFGKWWRLKLVCAGAEKLGF